MEPIQVRLRERYRTGRGNSSHHSTHNSGRVGTHNAKHSWWTTPTQFGYTLNGGKVPKQIVQPAQVLTFTGRGYQLVKAKA